MMGVFNRWLLVSGLTFLPFILSGCQSLGEAANVHADSEPGKVELAALVRQREVMLVARNSFQVDGGLGIWTDSETISARLDWQQAPDELDLTLTGPLGMGTLQLIDDGAKVTLNRGDQSVAQGRVADVVLQNGLGLSVPVPLNELGFWIRGLPGNAATVVRDNEGKLSSLSFTDAQGTHWQARFRRYQPWDGLAMPSLITASGGPYSVRLRLKDWQYASKTTVPVRPESNNRLPIPGR